MICKKLSITLALALAVSGAAAAAAPTAAVPAVNASAATVQATPISGTVTHDFTAQGLQSDYFEITGNLSKDKGTASYNGLTLTQCLKMESSTNITFTTNGSAALTLVLLDSGSVKIDGTAYNAVNNLVQVNFGAGSHTITKGSGTSNLFYIEVQGDGSAPTSTAPQQGTEPSATTATTAQGNPNQTVGDITVVSSGGWNEMLYATLSGVKDSDVTAVSYSGAADGKLSGEDFEYLVRDTSAGVRVDIPGVPAGTYTLNIETKKGSVSISNISVAAQDRSGYAHFNYDAGVGAYTDAGTLKANAIVLYVTDANKDSVSVTSKDGTKVTGIGNILNSAGTDTSKGGKPNTNNGIIKKLAEDGTPLVVRIIGDVKAPDGLTAYDSVDYGGSVGDNGFMARMKSGKDVTIEGIGTDATVDGWGFHFMAESAAPDYGKSFEVRNISFRNVPEDCIGMEGVQEGSKLTASVERCWIHNNAFYKPTINNPAESDKAGGDGACDFKRGMYFTNSYNYYEGYHKTNLVGASDSNLQFHLTYHHNYWKNCESRGPLTRQANVHMYNNVFEGQTSYCQNTRANAYIFSEYNLFEKCKSPQRVDSGAIKSYNDTLIDCTKDMKATVVTDKSQKVSSDCQYENFDLDSKVSYIPSNAYELLTDTSQLKTYFKSYGGPLADQSISGSAAKDPAQTTASETTTVTAITTTEAVIETTTTTDAVPDPVTTTEAVTTTTTAVVTTTESASSETTTTAVPEAAVQYGNVNCSEGVDVADAVLLARYIAQDPDAKISDVGLLNADVDHSGTTDAADVALLLQYIARLITEF